MHCNLHLTHLKDDEDVVMVALQEDGGALEFISKRLRANRKFVQIAVKNDGCALKFAAFTFQRDKEIILTAINNTNHKRYIQSLIPYCLKIDKDIISAIKR